VSSWVDRDLSALLPGDGTADRRLLDQWMEN
jgi:hypothetical protein